MVVSVQRLGDSSWYSVDGKSLSGTITDAQGAAQNLVSVVRLVQHNSQAVVQFAYYLTGKKGESETVKLLLRSDEVDIAEKTITADALHCNQAFLQLILQKTLVSGTVKDNCAALKKIVATQEKELPIDTYTEEEKNRMGEQKHANSSL
ncbi:MAG: hypothetical protein IPL33_12805 [Sphingobacteriales bacterium]|nr:hypothetical protein [Sphingobacteriales bacterium]